MRLGPSAVRVKTRAEEAVAVLADHGWVSTVSERPKVCRLRHKEGDDAV
jgi:hypothetical protein